MHFKYFKPHRTNMEVCFSLLSDGEARGNPMVSGFQDELDPDDTGPSFPQPKTLPPSKDVTLTSDEEEGEQVAPIVTQDQDLDSEPELKAYVIVFFFFYSILFLFDCPPTTSHHRN